MAHSPAFGVKVYVPLSVLLTAGDHVPLTPFKDVVGNVGATSPLHIAAIGAKVGNIPLVMVTTAVALSALHCVLAPSGSSVIMVIVTLPLLISVADGV